MICRCGKEYKPNPRGIKLFCSRVCFYKYRKPRPEGLTYKISKRNKSWFKKGFKPWNKGKRTGIIPPNFKGDNVGYDALHDWVHRHKGKPIKCDHCGKGKTTPKSIQWANKSHEYLRDLDDWIPLCTPCHRKYDKK